MKNCDEDDVCALTERDCEWSCLSRYYGRFDYTFDYPIQPSVTLWLRVGIRVGPCYIQRVAGECNYEQCC